MTDSDPTYIGRVRQVLGSQVTVELDPRLVGVSPMYQGEVQSIGQIGSLVRLPQGVIDLVGAVTLIGISELVQTSDLVRVPSAGERWLQVQLLGEVDRASGTFTRGVGTYPGLDDSVHFTVGRDVSAVYPQVSDEWIRVGRHASSTGVAVTIDANKLVTRHSAVVGATGSGKTSAVATIVQSFADGSWPSANVIVIDGHGEYTAALGDHASVRSVTGVGDRSLRVPFWALPAADILRAFCGVEPGATALKAFEAAVVAERVAFAAACSWLDLDPATITSDTPIPFDLRKVWYSMDRENREIRGVKTDPTTARIVTEGDPAQLIPAQFEPYGPGGAAPFQAPNYNLFGRIPELLRGGLQDSRLHFLQEPAGDPTGSDPLGQCLSEWLGGEKPVSVLDFSGVPTGSSDLAVGVILQLLFEVALRTHADEVGIGRPRPVLIVLEEAHRYLAESAVDAARVAVDRIAREGRKYGVGLMLVTQRPSELPDTALSQCGTLIALRLSNAADQGRVKSALPDNVAGLAEALPSLRTGEALVSGEAIVLPTRVLVDRPNPKPLADDPDLSSWRNPATDPSVLGALERWRGRL